MSQTEEPRSALGESADGYARRLRWPRLTRRTGSHLGRMRAGLFYGVMPALSAVNAAVGLLLPLLLDPEQFGRYAIIVTLFQYGLIFDFGLSQLIDRRVPVLIARERAGRDPGTAELPTPAPGDGERDQFVNAVLWTRLYIALAVLLGGGAIIGVLQAAGRMPFSPMACMLSLTAGLCFMVILGPASVYRAASNRRAFGRINIAVMLILAVARPAGLLAGGITGSFLALAASYAVLACWVQARMPPRVPPGATAALSLMLQGLPLFMTSFVWAFYMTANRWVVSATANGVETGHFAFGSNIVTLIVGAIGSLAQFYYPRVVTQAAGGGAFSVSSRLGRDFCLLVAAVSLPSAVGVIVGPSLVHLLYPKFVPAIPIVLLLLLAVPSLTVASWLMPVALSTASKPWIEGLVVYPTALAVLLVATWVGLAAGGTTGAAWGLVASAAPLLALQLTTLRQARLLRWRDGLRIGGASALATGLLAALEFA